MSIEDIILGAIPDTFWHLVDLAREQPERFQQRIGELDREALIDFCRVYDRAAGELYGESHQEYVDPDLSEDGVNDICEWVVAQGRDHYVKVLRDPKLMPYRVDDHDPHLAFTSHVCREYYRRYNESLIM